MYVKFLNSFSSKLKQVSPDNLIKKGIKIRGFSKTNIEKTYLRVEVNIKSRGILNNSCPEPRAAGGPVRSLSNDRLPSSDSVAKITAMSSSLTYKEVIKNGSSDLFKFKLRFFKRVEQYR